MWVPLLLTSFVKTGSYLTLSKHIEYSNLLRYQMPKHDTFSDFPLSFTNLWTNPEPTSYIKKQIVDMFLCCIVLIMYYDRCDHFAFTEVNILQTLKLFL